MGDWSRVWIFDDHFNGKNLGLLGSKLEVARGLALRRDFF
ncbi:hypothetical protein TDIS_0155 [Thermosulfurimonas dismutans]|uniref:Uncharacterized protein n=1 Tax=Thermosulfurimonas dismutans TaxID=999894 RepID=A0A179D6G7_9BACT|nr:hypothetical protein TDIS_0155 [Thermosulfurimonas dismutans]